MSETKRAFLLVPASPDFGHTFDGELERIRADERARDVGIVVLMPRSVQPSALMFAAYLWPLALKGTGVRRIAVVLGVAAYAIAEPILRGCARRMSDQKIDVAFFHEAQLETSDALGAWCERRKARRRVTTDSLVKICERYADRGDLQSAMCALKIAEQGALDRDDVAREPAGQTLNLKGDEARDFKRGAATVSLRRAVDEEEASAA